MAPRRILVVDDSPTIRRVVSQVLRAGGFDVATAENGDTGLAEARATIPDLILLDFMMPGMNGYQFVKQLDLEGAVQCPVVLMVTRTDQVPEGALRTLGVVDTITKPFSPEAIVTLVGYCLERHGTVPRQETTRVTKLSAPPEDALHSGPNARPQHAEDAATTPGRSAYAPVPSDVETRSSIAGGEPELSVEGAPSSDRDRFRADEALKDIARLVADALSARGVADADGLATSICADLRAGMSSKKIADMLRTPQASLSGDLSAVPLPEVLQLLKFQGQTGVLEVSLELGEGHAPARFEVAVKSGMIVSVRGTSLRSDLLLGNYFIGAGIVSRAQIDAVLKKSAPPDAATPPPLGQRLVDAGLITTEQLRRCVGAQAQDLMTELLRARRGFFGLRRGEHLLPAVQLNPGFSVDNLLFEALRRMDEWSVIEQHVPSFDARFVRFSDDVSDLSPDEIEVLSVFTGRGELSLTVHDVLRISSLRAFDCCKVLYRLCVLRRIRRVDDGRSGGRLVGEPSGEGIAVTMDSAEGPTVPVDLSFSDPSGTPEKPA
jgi:CheY-like chemotaxis protein